MARNDYFVSVDWLRDHLDDPRVSLVDASWHMPAAGRDAGAEYRTGHIPGAVFFDLDAIADRSSGLPHMLPSAEAFAAAVGGLGVSDEDDIVVYDSIGLFSVPRVRWSFKAMGARSVRILDGGLPGWTAAGLTLEPGTVSRPAAFFRARLDASAVRSHDDVRSALGTRVQIVDARSAGRFAGKEAEPRAGLRSGHMPGAVNLPFGELVDGGKLKDETAVTAAFAARGVDLARPIITTCGSGVSAAVLSLALETIGAADVSLYDGSWTDWGARSDAPIVSD